MLISELQKKLEDLKNKHGDLPVRICVGYESDEIDVVQIDADLKEVILW